MSGIYIHIPFCAQACHYCDFHFSTNTSLQVALVKALTKELESRKDYLGSTEINTIYLGGGTPSLLSYSQIDSLFEAIHKNYRVTTNPEITLEANPEDLTTSYLQSINQTPINRLSIGVQTFDNHTLKKLNRIHDAATAIRAVQYSQDMGITNLNVDLIFAIPPAASMLKRYTRDLERLTHLNVPHVSLYGLTIESRTVFAHLKHKGRLKEVPDDLQATAFDLGSEFLQRQGYEHYEVSNYSLPEFHSRHNTAYWLGTPYLGIGPGAHSFNGTERAFNKKNNPEYIRSVRNFDAIRTTESLGPNDQLNEYLITRLRTHWGIDLDEMEKHFKFVPNAAITRQMHRWVEQKKATWYGASFRLTSEGFAVADEVALSMSMQND